MKHIALFLLLAALYLGGSTQAQQTQLIARPTGFDIQGHRGSRGLKPENTLPAFETALDLGVTTLEMDLHFTRDGIVIVWHDDRIDKASCGLEQGASSDVPDPDALIVQGDSLLISALTWEQVQQYRCDRNPNPSRFPDQDNSATPLAGDDYHIPGLAEIFDFVEQYALSEDKTPEQRQGASQVLFNIETKRDPDNPQGIGDNFDGDSAGEFEQAILALVEEYEIEDRVSIQSFDHRSLWAVARENPDIRLVALTTRQIPDFEELVARGAEVWSPDYRDLSPELLQSAHATGLQVIPWTVNEPHDMMRLVAMGVDGIISDRPDVLLGIFEP